MKTVSQLTMKITVKSLNTDQHFAVRRCLSGVQILLKPDASKALNPDPESSHWGGVTAEGLTLVQVVQSVRDAAVWIAGFYSGTRLQSLSNGFFYPAKD